MIIHSRRTLLRNKNTAKWFPELITIEKQTICGLLAHEVKMDVALFDGIWRTVDIIQRCPARHPGYLEYDTVNIPTIFPR